MLQSLCRFFLSYVSGFRGNTLIILPFFCLYRYIWNLISLCPKSWQFIRCQWWNVPKYIYFYNFSLEYKYFSATQYFPSGYIYLVNGLNLCRMCFTICLSFTHTHTQMAASYLTRHWSDHREQFGLQTLQHVDLSCLYIMLAILVLNLLTWGIWLCFNQFLWLLSSL